MAIEKDYLDKIYDKQERISDDISEIKVTLASQHESLKEHMRRTDLAEEHIETVKADIKPIQTHVDRVEGVVKFIGVLSLITGTIASLLKILGKI